MTASASTLSLLTLLAASLLAACASQSSNKNIAYSNFDAGDYVVPAGRSATGSGGASDGSGVPLAVLDSTNV